jgi:hypothetical protein
MPPNAMLKLSCQVLSFEFKACRIINLSLFEQYIGVSDKRK